MSKYSDVYFKDGSVGYYLQIDNYNDKQHYRKIFCPDCKEAPIFVKRMQKSEPFFFAENTEKHNEDCQYYQKRIPYKVITRLVSSNDIEDKKRLQFLIDVGLAATMRILNTPEQLKGRGKGKTKEHITTSISNNTTPTITNKKETLPRVNFSRIKKNEDYIGEHIIVYGRGNLKINLIEKTDPKTDEQYILKQLQFRNKGEFIFSTFLTEPQTLYFKKEGVFEDCKFAVFGKLVKNSNFYNLQILHTDNIKIE